MIRFVRPAVFTLAPLALTAALLGCAATPPAPKAAPTGEIKGTAWTHTPQSLAASVQNANVVLPAQATGGAAYSGRVLGSKRRQSGLFLSKDSNALWRF